MVQAGYEMPGGGPGLGGNILCQVFSWTHFTAPQWRHTVSIAPSLCRPGSMPWYLGECSVPARLQVRGPPITPEQLQ